MPIFVYKFPPGGLVSLSQESAISPGPEYVEISLADLIAFQELWSPRRANPVVDALPEYNAATQRLESYLEADVAANVFRKKWTVVAMNQQEIDAAAASAERAAVVATSSQIAADIAESNTDQDQAQVFISLTKAERELAATTNAEILNSAKRDKSSEQRYRRLARAVRSLLRSQ